VLPTAYRAGPTSVPRRARPDLRRAYPSQGGPNRFETGLSVPRRANVSRGGPIRPEVGLSVPRRAYQFRGGPLCPEAGLFSPEAGLSRCGSERKHGCSAEQVPVSAYGGSSKNLKDQWAREILMGLVEKAYSCTPDPPPASNPAADWEGAPVGGAEDFQTWGEDDRCAFPCPIPVRISIV